MILSTNASSRLTVHFSACLLVLLVASQACSQSDENMHCEPFEGASAIADPWFPTDPDFNNFVHIEFFGTPNSGDWTENIIQAQNFLDEGPGYIFFPPGKEFLCKSPFIPRSETTYYGGGTLKMEFLPVDVDMYDRDFVRFGVGIVPGDEFHDITFGGLIFDFNGFRTNSNIIEWNSIRNVTNILLTNLTFIDSKCGTDDSQNIPNDTDSWAINIGGYGTMNGFTVQDCVHISPVHQFLSSGFKAEVAEGTPDEDCTPGIAASINNLKILRNTLHGSRSVAISVKTSKRNPTCPNLFVEINNVWIDGNTIINPWNNSISVGLDGSTDRLRGVNIDGMYITNNVLRWDDFEYFNNLQSTAAIRCYVGDAAGSTCENVLIQGNTVIDNHPREVTGVSVTSGDYLNAPQPENFEIIDNFFPNVKISEIVSSGIHVENNVISSEDPTPSVLELGAYPFDSINDLPFLAHPVQLDLSTLDISFRLYVPELPATNQDYYYLFYHDHKNYIRLHNNGKILMKIDAQSVELVNSNDIKPNTIYDVTIAGIGNNQIRTTFNDEVNTANLPVGQSYLPISVIGGQLHPNAIQLNPTQILNGFIWDISISDSVTNVDLPGLVQDPTVEPWADSVMTPTMPYVFNGENDIPVVTFPIRQSLDGIDLQFRFYCKDFSTESLLFYQDQQNLIRINDIDDDEGPALIWKTENQQKTLISKDILKVNRSYHVQIRDTLEGPGVDIKTFLNGIHEENISYAGNIPELRIQSIGGRSNDARIFEGSIWDISIRGDSTCEDSSTSVISDCFERYNGAIRDDEGVWDDLLGSNILTFNHAHLTPLNNFEFANDRLVSFNNPLTIPYDTPFEISFWMRVDDLPTSEEKVLFFQNGTNFISLRDDGKIHFRTDGVNTNLFNSDNDKIVENGTYHVRIIGNGNTVSAVVNNSTGNSADPDEQDMSVDSFTINAIGGNSNTSGSLFDGMIWDLSITIDSVPAAQYLGDNSENAILPWDDLIGGHDGVVENF